MLLIAILHVTQVPWMLHHFTYNFLEEQHTEPTASKSRTQKLQGRVGNTQAAYLHRSSWWVFTSHWCWLLWFGLVWLRWVTETEGRWNQWIPWGKQRLFNTKMKIKAYSLRKKNVFFLVMLSQIFSCALAFYGFTVGRSTIRNCYLPLGIIFAWVSQ